MELPSYLPVENSAAEEVGEDSHQTQERQERAVNEHFQQLGGAGRDDVLRVIPRYELLEGSPTTFRNQGVSVCGKTV